MFLLRKSKNFKIDGEKPFSYMIPQTYSEDFYDQHMKMSISSAKVIIPIILEYLEPKSVIDVGCGIGTWLSVWEKFGVKEIVGIDGDYVNIKNLLINKEKFIVANLDKGYKSLKKFDIVTCLEVAEHINPDSANLFIDSLCNLGEVIIFSAAIPGQEGTLHINEQYPDYWLSLFEKNNFIPIDCIRRKVWSNEKVSTWYKQNILIYVNNEYLAKFGKLKLEAISTDIKFLKLVHPEYFDYKCSKVQYYERVLKSPRLLFKYLVKSLYTRIFNSRKL